MLASRNILASLSVLTCFVLLGCMGESGSSQTALNPEGFWGGCERPDDSDVAGGFYDGDEQRIFVTFQLRGDAENGSYTADVRHPDVSFPAATRKGCPARDLQFAGQLDGYRFEGVFNGIQRTESWSVEIEFSEDGQSARGTYEIIVSEHTYFTESRDGGPLCPGLTGTFEVARQLVTVKEGVGPPEQECPAATAYLR